MIVTIATVSWLLRALIVTIGAISAYMLHAYF